jgi:putative hydrolase of the HAD superfamily
MDLLLLDFDDVCVATTPLYIEAKEQFADFLAEESDQQGLSFYRQTVLEEFDHLDIKRAQELGYHQDRFGDSLVLFTQTFLGQPTLSWGVQERLARIGRYPFTQEAPPLPGVGNLLRAFHGQDLPIVVLTQGDPEIQYRRLGQFPYKHYLSGFRVVPRKTEAAFAEVLGDHDADPGRSWMVGNSYGSDIRPALAVGMKAAWLRGAEWAGWETRHANLLMGEVYMADTLRDIQEHIFQEEGLV